VHLVRRLVAVVADDEVLAALDRLREGDDPYLRLAAAQAELVHRRDRAQRRLADLAGSGEPTVALAATATLRAGEHPALQNVQHSDEES
jgi:hypothetical protein